MKIFVFDLELNKDTDQDTGGSTTDVIQIGGVLYDTDSGEVSESFNRFIKLKTPLNGELRLSKFIIKLTGINDSTITTEGVTLVQAYNDLYTFLNKHKVSRICATWGSGDVQSLRDDLKSYVDHLSYSVEGWDEGEVEGFTKKYLLNGCDKVTFYQPIVSPWFFSNYETTGFFDVKKMYQLYMISINKRSNGGLRKAIKELNITQPKNIRYHNAVSDAHLTALILDFIKNRLGKTDNS